jgi:hypothetical protein
MRKGRASGFGRNRLRFLLRLDSFSGNIGSTHLHTLPGSAVLGDLIKSSVYGRQCRSNPASLPKIALFQEMQKFSLLLLGESVHIGL